MPTGPAVAPGARPPRFARLDALPQREIERVTLAVDIGLALLHGVGVAAGKLAVGRMRSDGEVHVAATRVGVAGVDEPAHQLDHLGHVAGRTRFDGGWQAADRGVRVVEQPVVALPDLPPRRALGLRGSDDLVVDVRDVAAEHHLIAAGRQPTRQDIERDSRADVTDVGRRLHGRPAQVHRDATWFEWHERADLATASVVETKWHESKGRA